MDNLIKDSALLELAAWLEPDSDLPGWDILKGSPFGAALGAPQGSVALPGGQFTAIQNYYAEYHLEFFRQRRFNDFPSRLHALLLFATRTDAEIFQGKHPALVFGKHLVRARSRGPYICSFHDASWLDYLRLPHSLGLEALDQVADHYWSGRTVEEVVPAFMNDPWREPPVIEALFQGSLEPEAPAFQSARYTHSGWLPEFA